MNRDALARFVARPSVRVLPVTARTAEHYAHLWNHARGMGRPLPANDLWIAASALETGRTLVTADAHFAVLELIPVALLT